jgi:hypothetical protein
VNVDGSFSYEITQDTTQALYGEQYFVVVQHPGMNGVYDIDLGADPQYVYDYGINAGSGGPSVSLFKMWGPGSLQGFDAFEALTQAIHQPYIDDTYTKAQFLIMPNLTATVSPSTVAHGQKIFINGTAEGPPSSVAIWILGKNYASRNTETVNVDGSFSYEITQDTTQALYSEQYFVVVQHPGMNGIYDIDICGGIPQDVCDYSGTTPVSLFKIWGPGSLQGLDAFEALTQAIKNNQPIIDDAYTQAQFLIVNSSKIGIYRNGVWYLRNSNTGGNADTTFRYGNTAGDIPVVGDWNGDGIDTIGVYRSGVFYLRNSNTNGIADLAFTYGQPGDIPVVGDWVGIGTDTIGIYRKGVFYLRNSNTGGIADLTFGYGNIAGDIPVVSDWAGSGKDTIGVYRNGVFYLRNSNTNGIANLAFTYGQQIGRAHV